LFYDRDARRCTIEASGAEVYGRSKATGLGVITADGDSETRISIEGHIVVSGPLERQAEAIGLDVLRDLLAQFARNIEKLATTQGTPAPDAAALPMVEWEEAELPPVIDVTPVERVAPPPRPRAAGWWRHLFGSSLLRGS
jgi:hypothetical protein